MRNRNLPIARVAALSIFAVTVILTGMPASAQQENVLHSFNINGRDGYIPSASLILDPAGNLYGTTPVGGFAEGGIAFKLEPQTGGGWAIKILHAFTGRGTDGSNPTASLIFDAAGNLYGTTNLAGAYGVGTVFELSPTASGGWTETTLYAFGNGSDGQRPASALIFDPQGNLYGTTEQGGIYGLGTVFELSPAVSGGWTETVLHSFGNGTDGQYPEASLIFDAAGNLYGTTTEGGTYKNGAVFKLTPNAGSWTEKILHSFNPNGIDGDIPFAGLVMDKTGNLYGTTNYGGAYGCGAVFELPKSGAEKILHNFSGPPYDGQNPYAGVTFDASGNLYGTTTNGGAAPAGTVFEMTPTGNGWIEKIVHSFGTSNTDGSFPNASVTFDAFGNLYGTTFDGGSHQDGTVFAIRP
jgi:uncharacterized repeat protein (TIGR03803 family)